MSTAIAVRFPAGRYHATPWGSHANEAGVEWPPSPWRILRALVAAWHRKVSPAEFPEDTLVALIESLSAADPVFRLPTVVRAHSRHYMPVRAGGADRPVLIFDAFARIGSDQELIVAWPNLVLDGRQRDLLSALVHVTGYLGRAESWTEARLLDVYDGDFNCAPVDPDRIANGGTGASLELIAPINALAYQEWRNNAITELGLTAKRLTRAQQRILSTMPPRLLDALRLDTGDLRDAGWNLAPGARMATYVLPPGDAALGTITRRNAGRPRRITTARIALAGRPLPRIEDAVRIGELVRLAAISAADRVLGSEGVPPEISGHGLGGEPNHQHAFYLPEDASGDGFIDHVLIHAPGGLSPGAVNALDQIRRLWIPNGAQWSVLFEGAWSEASNAGSVYGGSATRWISVTPYLHPWFAKRGFGVPEQIGRECAQRGLPAPITVRALASVRAGSRERRPVHFHRFRSKHGLRQPDSRGTGVEITFASRVSGPLALGFGCHYGLGMFVPMKG